MNYSVILRFYAISPDKKGLRLKPAMTGSLMIFFKFLHGFNQCNDCFFGQSIVG